MKKHYITANELLLDAFKLAKLTHEKGFIPHFIIGIWRGGAPVGIAVQEYFEYMGIKTDHIAIRTSSYTGINQQDKNVKVFGLNYVIDTVTPDMKVLIVDDVFDSGRSVRAVLEKIRKKAGKRTPHEIKIACPWFKPTKNQTRLTPDFFVHTTEQWLVFPHELQGLSIEEIAENKGEELAQLLRDKMHKE